MDIEEIIIETLRIAEQMELEHEGPPNIYTCLVRNNSTESVFSEVVLTGELCVCAANRQVAVLLFFLIQGVFDHGDHRLEWYTRELERCINLDYDDVTADDVIKLWTDQYQSTVEIKEHNIIQPIVVQPMAMDRGNVTLIPSVCDIWTLPRIRRQFTD